MTDLSKLLGLPAVPKCMKCLWRYIHKSKYAETRVLRHKGWGGRRLGAYKHDVCASGFTPKRVTLGRTVKLWLKLLISECDLEQGRAGPAGTSYGDSGPYLGHPFGN